MNIKLIPIKKKKQIYEEDQIIKIDQIQEPKKQFINLHQKIKLQTNIQHNAIPSPLKCKVINQKQQLDKIIYNFKQQNKLKIFNFDSFKNIKELVNEKDLFSHYSKYLQKIKLEKQEKLQEKIQEQQEYHIDQKISHKNISIDIDNNQKQIFKLVQTKSILPITKSNRNIDISMDQNIIRQSSQRQINVCLDQIEINKIKENYQQEKQNIQNSLAQQNSLIRNIIKKEKTMVKQFSQGYIRDVVNQDQHIKQSQNKKNKDFMKSISAFSQKQDSDEDDQLQQYLQDN